jgi:hypothetical protein
MFAGIVFFCLLFARHFLRDHGIDLSIPPPHPPDLDSPRQTWRSRPMPALGERVNSRFRPQRNLAFGVRRRRIGFIPRRAHDSQPPATYPYVMGTISISNPRFLFLSYFVFRLGSRRPSENYADRQAVSTLYDTADGPFKPLLLRASIYFLI